MNWSQVRKRKDLETEKERVRCVSQRPANLVRITSTLNDHE